MPKLNNKKKEKPFKLDIKKLNGRKLCVVDVSAVMRTYFVETEPEHIMENGILYLADANGNFLLDNNGERMVYARSNKFKMRKPLSAMVYGERVNTSAMFGLFSLMQQYKFSETEFIFCFDSPYNERKQEAGEDYKAGRAKVNNEYFNQVDAVENLLRKSGFCVLKEHGLEGDDLVILSARENYTKYDHVIVISNDYDISQVVNYNVYFRSVLNSRADITQENFEQVVKCPYNSILLYKALVGDSSDNIKGVTRFGPAAFKKFIVAENLEHQLPFVRIRNLEETIIRTSTTLSDKQKGEALISLRYVLPRLPKGKCNYQATPSEEINVVPFRAFLERYEMNKFLTYLNQD